MIKDILRKQSVEGLSNLDVLIAVHVTVGNDVETISKHMDISLIRVTQRVAYLQSEGILSEDSVIIPPIKSSSTERLAKVVTDSIRQTTPKKSRVRVKTKSKVRSSNNNKSPLEVDVNDWSPTHLLKYFEILWCEQSWKTPPPSWGVKDRMNAKRVLETYQGQCKALIDYMFNNWSILQTQFNIQGLPSISILWGFRNSIAPQAFGDVSSTKKSWGSSHDKEQNRNEGEETGW